MSTAIIYSPAASVMSGLIRLYQRFVSPYKGFCCAYRAKHRRRSCSAFARHAVMKRGIFSFLPLLMRRFKACEHAAATLDYESRERRRQGKDKKRWWSKNHTDCSPDLSSCCDVVSSCDAPGTCDAAGDCNPL